MNGKRKKWINKELLVNKNTKFVNKLIDVVGEEKIKELNIRQLFRLAKKLWNKKQILKEDII